MAFRLAAISLRQISSVADGPADGATYKADAARGQFSDTGPSPAKPWMLGHTVMPSWSTKPSRKRLRTSDRHPMVRIRSPSEMAYDAAGAA